MNGPEKRRLTRGFWATPWSAMEHSSPARTLWRLLGRWSTGSSRATIGQSITGAAAGGPRRLMRSSRPTALGTIPYLAEQKHEALGEVVFLPAAGDTLLANDGDLLDCNFRLGSARPRAASDSASTGCSTMPPPS